PAVRRLPPRRSSDLVAALPNVYNSAVAVNKTAAGESVLVGYVSLEAQDLGFDHRAAKERLAETMPAALVPRICVMDELPIRTSGDRKSTRLNSSNVA